MNHFEKKDTCYEDFCHACNGSGYDYFDDRRCEVCEGSGHTETCVTG